MVTRVEARLQLAVVCEGRSGVQLYSDETSSCRVETCRFAVPPEVGADNRELQSALLPALRWKMTR